MDLISTFVIVAILAAAGALFSGISPMATGREIAHLSSVEWMARRVGFQAVAFLLILFAIFALS